MGDGPGQVADAATIDEDMSCIECRYNLKTLSVASACPECGLPVARTLERVRLQRTEAGELRAQGVRSLDAWRRGVDIARAAWWLTGVQFVLLLGSRWSTTGQVILLGALVAPHVVGYWSAWHLFGGSGRIVRVGGRAAIVASLAGLGLVFINARWLTYYGRLLDYPLPFALRDYADPVGRALIVATPVVFALAWFTLMRVASLAGRYGWACAAGLTGTVGTLVALAHTVMFVAIGTGRNVGAFDVLQVASNPTLTSNLPSSMMVACISDLSRGYNGQIEMIVWFTLMLAIHLVPYFFFRRLRIDLARALADVH